MTPKLFPQPSSLFMGNALKGPSGVLSAQQSAVKALPPQFSTEGLVEAQFEATSKDGTKVPYFIVYKDTEGRCAVQYDRNKKRAVEASTVEYSRVNCLAVEGSGVVALTLCRYCIILISPLPIPYTQAKAVPLAE